eukprot:5347808-Prymnesium_polylepis.1
MSFHAVRAESTACQPRTPWYFAWLTRRSCSYSKRYGAARGARCSTTGAGIRLPLLRDCACRPSESVWVKHGCPASESEGIG